MNLQPAIRFAQGRCQPIEQTIERLETALHAHYACVYEAHEEAEGLHWGRLKIEGMEFTPMGKGATPAACKASTYAEAVEWLALRRVRALAGYKRGTASDDASQDTLKGLLSHIELNDAQLERVYASELAQHWVDAWNVTVGESISIPLEYIHGISGTNGLAAGNEIEEAIVQGINEVIERRAVITVIKNRLVLPTIDPATIDQGEIQGQLATLKTRGLVVTVKDLSFDGVLPCIGVYVRDPKVDPGLQSHHTFKAAAHFDRSLALSSCLTEYIQLSASSIDSSHGRMLCDDATDNFLPLFWFGYVPFADALFLEQGAIVPFDPGTAYDRCLDDIQQAREILESLGLQIMVVDMTDPKIDFPVVQVVIPGYSDILPYHPASSRVLFEGWTRDLPLGYIKGPDGSREPCNVKGLFPEW